MFRLTLKNLGANKTRFALTTFGVMLAVSFVVSAFVLGDGLRSSFGDVSRDVTAGVDLEVRPVSQFGDPEPLPIEMVATVAEVDGVADAVAGIESADDAVRPIKADGSGITTDGPPQLGFNWIENETLSPFSLVDGTPPKVGEFVVDYDSADKHGFVIGDTYDVITPSGRTQLALSGTSSFGQDNSTLGAVLMQMNTDEASELFGIDGITTVDVQVSEDADLEEVQAAVAAAVPGAEVVDQAVVLQETEEDFTNEIDLVGNIFLGFGGVALFVSIFIIYNTFAIVLGQRTRELALLRTIGADPKQIRRSVLGEALAIGLVASVGGIIGGVAVAKLLEALFAATGVDLPDYPLIIATRTIVAAVVIGVGVTMVAAVGPARRASSVPAMAALRGGAEAGAPGSRTRKVAGFGLLGVGVIAAVVGLAGAASSSITVTSLAVGAIAVFLGVTLLSPLMVGAITAVLGWPLRKSAGAAGQLAQKNAARNPRRTATTASALMIGLALVATALVVGESIKANLGTTIEQAATADYFVTDELEEVDFPATLASEIQELPSVEAASGFSYFDARVSGTVDSVVASRFDEMGELLDIDVQEGSYDTTVMYPVLVSVDEAASGGITIGDEITTGFSNGALAQATVTGLFDDQAIITEDYLFDSSILASAGIAYGDEWLAVALSAGADAETVDAFVGELARQFPQANIETADEFRERVEGLVDDVLAMVNMMLALAVVIALIGIGNTLALSVFERTRELGLVRAVGMTRRQLRRTVRFEAALVATFGAVLGVAIGLLFGWGIVSALPESLTSALAVPVGSILIVMLIAAVAGVVAAWLPARRAGRLDILDAIAQ